jgi:hypothetical protein
MLIKNNTVKLQNVLSIINTLPEANNGVELPNLKNEGTASDLLLGKELIDDEGNKVTGTFTIDSELSTQDDLIEQLRNAIDELPDVTSDDTLLQTKTITPTASQQIIEPDNGYDGLSSVTVNGDTNLISSNIKSGVSIFGVNGNYTGSGSGNSGSVEIKTFTCENDNVYDQSGINPTLSINPFIEGMTWQDFVNSSLNYIRYNGISLCKYAIVGNNISMMTGGGVTFYVSTDGTYSSRVVLTDLITAISYKPDFSGSEFN